MNIPFIPVKAHAVYRPYIYNLANWIKPCLPNVMYRHMLVTAIHSIGMVAGLEV